MAKKAIAVRTWREVSLYLDNNNHVIMVTPTAAINFGERGSESTFGEDAEGALKDGTSCWGFDHLTRAEWDGWDGEGESPRFGANDGTDSHSCVYGPVHCIALWSVGGLQVFGDTSEDYPQHVADYIEHSPNGEGVAGDPAWG